MQAHEQNERSLQLDAHFAALREENLAGLRKTERRLTYLQQDLEQLTLEAGTSDRDTAEGIPSGIIRPSFAQGADTCFPTNFHVSHVFPF